MTAQVDFLLTQGGRAAVIRNERIVADFGDFSRECDTFDQAACFCDAGDYGLLKISGKDAESFLHNQLSTNIKKLPAGQAQFSLYHTPKGRVIASFFIWRGEEDGVPCFYLLLARDLADIVYKRLAMYVLRAQAAIENLSAANAYLGLCGAEASGAIGAINTSCDAPKAGAVITQQNATMIAAANNLYVIVTPLTRLAEIWAIFVRHVPPAGRYLWRRAWILAGIPTITAATSEELLPYAANGDALGGLDFHKGCYPGQEIIARTRYLGRIKERLYLMRCAEKEVFAAGTPVFGPTFGEQACGMIVNAAADRAGQIMLVSLQTQAQSDAVHAGRVDGEKLTMLALPYALPSE